MHILKVGLKNRSYNIIIGQGALRQLGRHIKALGLGDVAYIITNRFIKKRHGAILDKVLKRARIERRFKLVADSEKSKSLETVSSIISEITAYDKNRKIFIIAFGGGVIGDLSGFVASIYKRGVSYIQVPTTLLAQVDSSIGGKTAVDLKEAKNLVGAFYQPGLVCSEVGFLKTLKPRQLRSGLAEAIKYGIIKEASFFHYLEKRYKDALLLKKPVIEFIVKKCSSIKADFVSRDEREERGIRTALNFGHTIGHALEAASGYNAYNHGEAIALGMLVAADISRRLGLIDNAVLVRIERLIKAVGLPLRIKGVGLTSIIKAYYHDKKFRGSKNRLVLISAIGKARVTEEVPLALIKEAIKSRF
ncbi:MAG: 3-dehydroquinate synthase [Candidatus Omnitrophica bacterium]|nr:3-dehydroquinate synthase [Candidatus Omnitrophota bacterium]